MICAQFRDIHQINLTGS